MNVPYLNFVCPNCGKSYYTTGMSYTTLAYYIPIYKDGININPDRNITTTEYICYNCGKKYKVQTRLGEIIDIIEENNKDNDNLNLIVDDTITIDLKNNIAINNK